MVNTGKPSREFFPLCIVPVKLGAKFCVAGCYLCRARRVRVSMLSLLKILFYSTLFRAGRSSLQCYNTQCDENKPHCFKCRKIGRECPGYRDSSFRFRDETMLTIKKASKISKKDLLEVPSSTAVFTARRSRAMNSDSLQQQKEIGYGGTLDLRNSRNLGKARPTTIPQTLGMSVGHQATCFFLSAYVLPPMNQGGEQPYAFVHKIISQDGMGSCFTPAFQAVSLAALATKPGYRRLRAIA